MMSIWATSYLDPSKLRISLYRSTPTSWSSLYTLLCMMSLKLQISWQYLAHRMAWQSILRRAHFTLLPCTTKEASHPSADLPIPIKQLPCKYLGLRLHFKKLRKSDLEPITDSVAKCLPRWKGKLLSIADRLALVKRVLSVIPIYMLTVFQLGSWVIKRIDRIRRLEEKHRR
jgi:hypothetical protein